MFAHFLLFLWHKINYKPTKFCQIINRQILNISMKMYDTFIKRKSVNCNLCIQFLIAIKIKSGVHVLLIIFSSQNYKIWLYLSLQTTHLKFMRHGEHNLCDVFVFERKCKRLFLLTLLCCSPNIIQFINLVFQNKFKKSKYYNITAF